MSVLKRWRRGAVIPSNPILLHSKPPLFLWLDFLQIIFQPVVCHVLLLRNEGWFGAWGNSRCAWELRLWQALETGLCAAQAPDGVVILFSRWDRWRGGLPGIFSTQAGDKVGILVWRRLPLTRGCWDIVSGANGPERTDWAVAVVWWAAVILQNAHTHWSNTTDLKQSKLLAVF